MNGILFPIGPCVLALATTAAVWDWKSRRIPNWLVAGALLISLPIQWSVHGLTEGTQTWLLGCIVGGLFFLPGYAIRAVGAGDVKLMAAIGALCGPAVAIYVGLVACALGGIWALATLLRRKRTKEGLTNALSMIVVLPGGIKAATQHGKNLREHSVGRLPYGVVIAISTIGVLLTTA
ncbi:A24 family peptidase [Paraburkholderia saeva]|uniref:A24 family peptidase n=1 Tax=Paraburkholderia saeva TaxID=2777537 RepID=UPI001D376102|nr:prepilin peptidase [Paraburkholderia saeva]CAG4888823.1 hypothetical protein R52603_00783 [Paraburkholderia saeva]CAG4893881.1 hypothetical protein R70241_01667 [Paraburkholderia saeva]